jgi:hypothetical protein
MSGEGGKKEGNKHLAFLCLRTHKEHILGRLQIILLFICLIYSGLKHPQVFEQFSNVRTRS